MLAIHPRGGLAGGIQDGLHLLGRDSVRRIELAIGAMLTQGLENRIHGLMRSREWGIDLCRCDRPDAKTDHATRSCHDTRWSFSGCLMAGKAGHRLAQWIEQRLGMA